MSHKLIGNDFLVSEELVNSLVVGNFIWEAIDIREAIKRSGRVKAAEGAKLRLTKLWTTTARYLLLYRPDLALTWPIATETEDRVELKSEIIQCP